MRNSPLVSPNLTERSAVVQAMFMHAVESVHADLASASESGTLPSRVSVRSLSPLPGTTSFVVDVCPEPSSASFRPISIDRVLVRMTDQTVGNRVVDGVNARERIRPTTIEMLAEAYSPVLHQPSPRYPVTSAHGSADEAVDLLTRLLL